MTAANQESLRTALKRTASVLKQSGERFALAGSYALWARGGPEPEHDVDFVIAEDDVEAVATALAGAGLPVQRPPEDWLFKICVDPVTVDVLHRVAGDPVTHALLDRATEIEVLSVRMPVLDATDATGARLRAMSEHYCDFGALLPAARAVREQIDWHRLRRDSADNDFALAFLYLVERLGITDPA